MSFAITMKVVSSLIGATLLLLLICALSIRIATAENESEDSEIKQTIKQNEECKDRSACKQAAENKLILCPIGSTCVFMTNDFVPYNLAIPR